MRFFVDTNIIVSAALFPRGKAAQVLSYVLESHDVIISDYVMRECETVFERKFPEKIVSLRAFLERIDFELFETPQTIDNSQYPSIRDSKDLPILVAAVLSDSDILLTGDKDFGTVNIKKPLIFTPNDYFDLIDKNKT